MRGEREWQGRNDLIAFLLHYCHFLFLDEGAAGSVTQSLQVFVCTGRVWCMCFSGVGIFCCSSVVKCMWELDSSGCDS